MSEEEIIEILEDRDILIDTLYETYRQSIVKPFDKAIKGLLDLYNKEKEKNKVLKDINFVETIIKENNYIHKDKIKAKIEDEQKECFLYKNGTKCEECMERCTIEGLQELLEESNMHE